MKLMRTMSKRVLEESNGGKDPICYLVVSHGFLLDGLSHMLVKFKKSKF